MLVTTVSDYICTPATGNIGYLSELIGGKGVQFRRTPADYDYSWHTAPQRQFIVNLDAEVEIEVSSGEKRVIPKGGVFFVEDVTGKLTLQRPMIQNYWGPNNAELCNRNTCSGLPPF